MTCPKCDEGTVKNILFKHSGQYAYLCDFCGAVWMHGEDVSESSGSTIGALTNDNELEYAFIDVEKKNEDAKSVMYPKFK